MPVKRPLELLIPTAQAFAAESVHADQFRMEWRAHPYYEIHYLLKGRVRYLRRGLSEPIVISSGCFYPVSKGISHRIEDLSQPTLLLLCLSSEFIEKNPERHLLWQRLCARQHTPIRPDCILCERLYQMLRRIMAEQSSQRPGSQLAIQALSDQVLISLARTSDRPEGDDNRERVADVIKMMNDSFFEPWNLDTAARRAHLSRRRFSEIFRSLTGTTFLKKLTLLRLDHADKLLREGTSTIAGVAFSCGFGDLSHFYRTFRKQYGYPPGQWNERRLS